MRKPVNALHVRNLTESLEFYRDTLGFRVDWAVDEAAQISWTEGPSVLLAHQSVSDIGRWMNNPHFVVFPGERLYFVTARDLNAVHAALCNQGISSTLDRQKDDSYKLAITDPDGYIISFWQASSVPDDVLVDRLEQSTERLSAALQGLTDDQLNLRRAPDKWSIRETVHHLADSDATSLIRMLMAAAEPGRSFNNNTYSQDLWVASLGSANRPVDTAITLIHASRLHVASLLRHLPNALDRTIETSLGGIVSLRTMIAMSVGHAAGHTEQIWETRRVHGLV